MNVVPPSGSGALVDSFVQHNSFINGAARVQFIHNYQITEGKLSSSDKTKLYDAYLFFTVNAELHSLDEAKANAKKWNSIVSKYSHLENFKVVFNTAEQDKVRCSLVRGQEQIHCCDFVEPPSILMRALRKYAQLI
ncbi:MAG: hypothetical protein ACPGUD_10345 [Parashewanella sp.]